LLDLPLSPDERTILRHKLRRYHNVWREALDVLTVYQNPSQSNEARYLRDKALRIHAAFGQDRKRLLAVFLLRLLPSFGKTGFRILEKLYRHRTGRAYRHTFVSRHDRL
jgi:hypothetical protein